MFVLNKMYIKKKGFGKLQIFPLVTKVGFLQLSYDGK